MFLSVGGANAADQVAATASVKQATQRCTSPVQASPPWVAGIGGNWVLSNDPSQSGCDLGQADHVEPGSTIKQVSPCNGDDYVDIFLSSEKMFPVKGGQAPTCAEVRIPEDFTDQASSQSILGKILTLPRHLFLPSEIETTHTTVDVRGPESVAEKVLKYSEGQTDIGPLLSDAPAGDYSLEFERLVPPTPSPAINLISVPWPPEEGEEFWTGEVEPGLFDVKVSGSQANEFWALVADSKSYERDRMEFRQARQTTYQWKSARSASVHNFLRAYLYTLATAAPTHP
jgi:hypothetical protein